MKFTSTGQIELAVGETAVTHDGTRFVCQKQWSCDDCMFQHNSQMCRALDCGEDCRSDRNSVIFRKLEHTQTPRVGEVVFTKDAKPARCTLSDDCDLRCIFTAEDGSCDSRLLCSWARDDGNSVQYFPITPESLAYESAPNPDPVVYHNIPDDPTGSAESHTADENKREIVLELLPGGLSDDGTMVNCRITRQTHRGNAFTADGSDVFKAANGWSFESMAFPEYQSKYKKLYTWGSSTDRDGEVIQIPVKDLTQVFAAVKEYNDTNGGAPAKPETHWLKEHGAYWTFLPGLTGTQQHKLDVDIVDRNNIRAGCYFKTREEAEEMLGKVKAMMRDHTASRDADEGNVFEVLGFCE